MLERAAGDRRRIILVGDYVNRGADSKTVLSLLVEAKHRLRDGLVLLAGNHELATLDFIDRGLLPAFAAHGGLATIRSYAGTVTGDVHRQFCRSFPSTHERLLREELDICFESPELLVSHTGYDPKHPEDRSADALVRTSHPDLLLDASARSHPPRPTVVFGHYVQASGEPWHEDGLFCLDTGCGTVNGPLTGLLLPERRFLSA
jgi:serine/threonine protein phosphatase 1